MNDKAPCPDRRDKGLWVLRWAVALAAIGGAAVHIPGFDVAVALELAGGVGLAI